MQEWICKSDYDRSSQQYKADYCIDPYRLCIVVYITEYNSCDTDQEGCCGNLCTCSIVYITTGYSCFREGSSYEECKCTQDQHQCQPRKCIEELLSLFTKVCSCDFTNRLSAVSDRSKQTGIVMNTTNEDGTKRYPQECRKPSEWKCTDHTCDRTCTCDG